MWLPKTRSIINNGLTDLQKPAQENSIEWI